MSITLFAVLTIACGLSSAAPTLGGAAVPVPHVRPLDAGARDDIRNGLLQSPTLAQLNRELAASHVVVYLRWNAFLATRGRLVYVAHANGTTYLLAEIASRQTATARIAVIAHELEHAVEADRAPSLTSDADFTRWFRCVGYETHPGAADTDAARDVERRVLAEASSARRRSLP